MDRTRDWRRYKSDCHFLRKLKRQTFYNYIYFIWSQYEVKLYNPRWIDMISTPDVNKFKSIRTSKWQTRNKTKYGKKGKKNWDWSADFNTRHKQKLFLKKELMEYDY